MGYGKKILAIIQSRCLERKANISSSSPLERRNYRIFVKRRKKRATRRALMRPIPLYSAAYNKVNKESNRRLDFPLRRIALLFFPSSTERGRKGIAHTLEPVQRQHSLFVLHSLCIIILHISFVDYVIDVQ